ncbi:recombinase family protein [Fuerstiella marisgermanici]|uniref:DNA-invertase hin n=1 Tax=Fuerstiella marisgermanici TaxID=1891926 RepID=A0A1P8WKP9_9PLAN|nr:recombinase family protein [Fuerstiella marisgermanici]APZ94617.1 DNA-invertase hin [Fuerstiella marisgermanici]
MSAIAVYIRVSSTSQNEASQKREVQRWLKGQGLDKDTFWFVDKASGKDTARPAFQKLQKAIWNGEVSTVVVWKLDRLSRSLRDGINILHDWCETGLRVVSVTQQIDFSGAVGKLMAAVFLAVGEMERENIRERQAAGIAAAKERGVYIGRKQGTTKGKPKRATELREKGLTDSEIAEAMGISRRTVQRYLKAHGIS